MIIGIINKTEEDMNKCLKEFWENTYEQVSKISKKMKDAKEEFNTNIKIFILKVKLKF
jgi:hypothetical protein